MTTTVRLFSVFFLFAFVLGGTARAQGEAEQDQQSLYDRLGGLAPIAVLVDDFMHVLVADGTLNANPSIAEARKRAPEAYLTYRATSLICQVTGGPCTYQGRGMKGAHAHLNITERQWDHMIVLFKAMMRKHKVPAREAQELLDIVNSQKAEIVSQAGGQDARGGSHAQGHPCRRGPRGGTGQGG